MSSPTLLVVDGDFLLHSSLRTSSSLLSTSRGTPVGGIQGGLFSVRGVLTKFSSLRRVLVVWDSGLSSRRLSVFPDYKQSRRDSSPDTLQHRALVADQKGRCQTIFPMFGLRSFSSSGREGDDLVYLSTQVSREEILVFSEDKDLLQLVSPRVSVYRPRAKVCVGASDVTGVVGCPVEGYVLLKALVGDAGDNIDGVPSVGQKTAQRIVSKVTSYSGVSLHSSILRACESLSRDDRKNRRRYLRVGEYLSLIDRNLELMSLERERFRDGEVSRMTSLLSAPCQFQEESVAQLFHVLEFGERISNWGAWVDPFTRLV